MEHVSVIIPTLRRPELVRRAVASALAQSWAALEVIVIIDGPDPATHAALTALQEPRLIVLQNATSLGPGVARNLAARAATGTWLAFLDDDDAWLPDKIARQLEGAAVDQPVVLSCRCTLRTPRATYIWPRRLPRPDEPVDAYLFGRDSLRRGGAYLATPTVVMPTWLFQRTGFGTTRQYEDTTLLLRCTRLEGARIIMHPEPLAVIYAEEQRESLGSDFAWTEGLDWLATMQPLFTPRGYAGFCLVTLGSQAARMRAWRAIPRLLGLAWRHGAPTPIQMALFVGFWLVPRDARRWLRGVVARQRQGQGSALDPLGPEAPDPLHEGE